MVIQLLKLIPCKSFYNNAAIHFLYFCFLHGLMFSLFKIGSTGGLALFWQGYYFPCDPVPMSPSIIALYYSHILTQLKPFVNTHFKIIRTSRKTVFPPDFSPLTLPVTSCLQASSHTSHPQTSKHLVPHHIYHHHLRNDNQYTNPIQFYH